MRNPVQHGKKTVGWGVGRENLGLFVESFLPGFRKKQHRNIFSHHRGRLAKFGWILTYLKISVEMAVTWFLPGSIQLLSQHEFGLCVSRGSNNERGSSNVQ